MPNIPALNMMKKSDILFGNEVISDSLLISTFSDYVSELMGGTERGSGIVYHTGSSIFDLVLTLYTALSCLLYDEMTPQELVSSLNYGDMIIYKDKTRAEFLGFDEKGFAKIQYGSERGKHQSPITETVAPASFYKIKPYQGDATILDGRGIRTDSKAKIEFMQAAFGKNKAEISGANRKSAIVVCSRNFADLFVDKVQICYDGDHAVCITDLMPVSYFSEDNEYPYRGNPGKNNPVLKFTNKLSIARDLVYKDEERQLFAVVALGGQIIKIGESELPDLLNRRSLKKTFMSLSIAEESGSLYESYPNASIFACTKDMLLSYSLPKEPRGPLTTEMEAQITNMLNREVIEHDVDGIISLNDYKEFRQNIVSVRHHIQHDDLIDKFVVECYSLLNYLTNITFPVTEIESARQTMGLDCPSTLEKILFLESIADKYSGVLSDLLSSIFCVVRKAYRAVDTINPKKAPFIAVLKDALRTGTVLILVPKSYYVDILKTLLPSDVNQTGNLHIKTMGAFDYDGNYDFVMFIGCLGTKRISIFSIFVAPTIECLLYPHERPLFAHQKRIYVEKERMLDKRSVIKYQSANDNFDKWDVDADISDNQEIDAYLEEITIKTALQTISTASGGGTIRADIVRIATTTEGESIFFTKYFTPYIFDRDQMTVIESSVSDVSAGDMLLFTKNSDQTKDIVEEIVKRIADSDEQIKDTFHKSKYWKKRLLTYKEANNLSFQNLSDAMKAYGTPKHAVTLRTWLNPESRIIAPREEDAFYQIALICEDEEMMASPESFFEACNTIRRLRIKILKLIGQCVVKSFQTEVEEATFLSDIVREELDILSQVVQIETIVDVSDVQVSVAYANRPYVF